MAHEQVLSGRYVLRELLAQGGMADVYLADDLLLQRVVAVKLLRVAGDAGGDAARDEGRLLANLNHPGIVRLFDVGAVEDRPYLVLELVRGRTLAEELRRGPLPLARVAALGAAVADALAYAHAQGLVHRDVKPGNIVVGEDGHPRLLDFGIACLEDATRVTATGTTVGTAAYLAPEQVVGDEVGPATDVYALGLVLLEAVTGHREYRGTQLETALARLHRPPEVPEHLPASWRDLLRAMTSRAPEDRPGAAAVAAALADAAVAANGKEPTPTRTLLLPQRRRPPGRSHTSARPSHRPPVRRSASIAAAVLLLAGAALGVVTTGGSEQPAVADIAAPATPTSAASLDEALRQLEEAVRP